MYTVYLITNLVNSKKYIGQTHLTSAERWKEHVWSINKLDYFHLAIKKHGKKAFFIEDLVQVETLEEVKKAEMLYIVWFKTHIRTIGYNSTLGGEAGEVPTEE